jgi:hypothetical protein
MVFALAKRRVNLEAQSRRAGKVIRKELWPHLNMYRRTLLALNRAGKEINYAKKICETKVPAPFYWNVLYEPVFHSIADLAATVKERQQRLVDELPPRLRKRKEKTQWHLLIRLYDFQLAKLGWRAGQRWFLEELDGSLRSYFARKKKRVPAETYYQLIQAIFVIAFNEHKPQTTVKMAVRRLRRKQEQALQR